MSKLEEHKFDPFVWALIVNRLERVPNDSTRWFIIAVSGF